MAKIAMLHTSFVFLNNETALKDLIESSFPNDQLIHFVDSDVLATVLRDKEISVSSEDRMIFLAQAAERAGADVIFSACSSLGPAVEKAKGHVNIPIVKVDEAMTKKAATTATTIGVLATAPSTLGPTADLIRKFATQEGRVVNVLPRVAEGAFEIMMAGDPERHDAMVLETAKSLKSEGVEMIVLAQASMSRLAEPLAQKLDLPVLSSPRLGVEHLGQVLQGLRR